jgi:hypothetical protein
MSTWRYFSEDDCFTALPMGNYLDAQLHILRASEPGMLPLIEESTKGQSLLLDLLVDGLRAEAANNDAALRRDKIRSRLDAAQRDLDRANAQLQTLEGRRTLLRMDVPENLGVQLNALGSQTAEWAQKRSEAQSIVTTLAAELEQVRRDADIRQKELDPRVLAGARAKLAKERSSVLAELLATAGPILDRLLIAQCAWQSTFTTQTLMLQQAHGRLAAEAVQKTATAGTGDTTATGLDPVEPPDVTPDVGLTSTGTLDPEPPDEPSEVAAMASP